MHLNYLWFGIICATVPLIRAEPELTLAMISWAIKITIEIWIWTMIVFKYFMNLPQYQHLFDHFL